jgi:hypothetical protein
LDRKLPSASTGAPTEDHIAQPGATFPPDTNESTGIDARTVVWVGSGFVVKVVLGVAGLGAVLTVGVDFGGLFFFVDFVDFADFVGFVDAPDEGTHPDSIVTATKTPGTIRVRIIPDLAF